MESAGPSHSSDKKKVSDEKTFQEAGETASAHKITIAAAGTSHSLDNKKVPDEKIFQEACKTASVKKITIAESTQLTSSLFMLHYEKISKNGNICKGWQVHDKLGKVPIAIKSMEYNTKNEKKVRDILGLQSHPNVINIIQSGTFYTGPFKHIFIAMEYYGLQTLTHSIKNPEKPKSRQLKLNLVKQLIDGVAHLHNNIITHGGLQPDNILVSDDGQRIKIICPGNHIRTSRRRVMLGEDIWSAPEIQDAGVDTITNQADIFSLALVIYYILTDGSHAFGDSDDVRKQNTKLYKDLDLTQLESDMKDLIYWMLRFNPHERPSMEQIREHKCFGGEVVCPFLEQSSLTRTASNKVIVSRDINEENLLGNPKSLGMNIKIDNLQQVCTGDIQPNIIEEQIFNPQDKHIWDNEDNMNQIQSEPVKQEFRLIDSVESEVDLNDYRTIGFAEMSNENSLLMQSWCMQVEDEKTEKVTIHVLQQEEKTLKWKITEKLQIQSKIISGKTAIGIPLSPINHDIFKVKCHWFIFAHLKEQKYNLGFSLADSLWQDSVNTKMVSENFKILLSFNTFVAELNDNIKFYITCPTHERRKKVSTFRIDQLFTKQISPMVPFLLPCHKECKQTEWNCRLVKSSIASDANAELGIVDDILVNIPSDSVFETVSKAWRNVICKKHPSAHYINKLWSAITYSLQRTGCIKGIYNDPDNFQEVKVSIIEGDFFLSWNPQENLDQDYNVSVFRTGILIHKIQTSSPAARYTPLQPSTEYFFKVQTHDFEALSQNVKSAPCKVKNVVSFIKENKIHVTWDDMKNDSLSVHIRVLYYGQESGTYIGEDGKFTLATFQPASTYSFQVWARDKFGIDSAVVSTNQVMTPNLGIDEGHSESSPETSYLGQNIHVQLNKPLRRGFNVYVGFVDFGSSRKKVAVKVLGIRSRNHAYRELIHAMELRHRNIVEYIRSSFSAMSTEMYIAMELCMVETLHEKVLHKTIKELDIEYKDVLYQISSGIEYMHKMGTVHRDLKPQNILISLDGKTIKLSDFGLTKKISHETQAKKSSHYIGTQGWAAPEQFTAESETLSTKSDIYSAGVIFYFVLSEGEHPFGKEMRKCQMAMVEGAKYDISHLKGPEVLLAQDIISKMLEYNLNNRPNAAEVLDHPFFWTISKRLSFVVNVGNYLNNFQYYTSEFIQKINYKWKIVHSSCCGRNVYDAMHREILLLTPLQYMSSYGIMDLPPLRQMPFYEITNLAPSQYMPFNEITDLVRMIRNSYYHNRYNVYEYLPKLHLYIERNFPHLFTFLYDEFNEMVVNEPKFPGSAVSPNFYFAHFDHF
ncbi:uncharacterized protein LOC120326396 [Styela clava]